MYKILSVGGSTIIPKTGFDVDFLGRFRDLILGRVKKGEKYILVVGGGATCRAYQQAALAVASLKPKQLDLLGIYVTQSNAQFVRFIFDGYAHSEIIIDPTKKIKTNKPIIVAGGWKPGCSTDKDAVLIAKTYGAKEMYNLSNIDYVYDSDPIINPKAKIFERLTWKQYRHIVGNKWVPGAHLPFDPAAAKEAEKNKITVKFVKGTELSEVGGAISGLEFAGTTIK